jgi:hypothetical protein
MQTLIDLFETFGQRGEKSSWWGVAYRVRQIYEMELSTGRAFFMRVFRELAEPELPLYY